MRVYVPKNYDVKSATISPGYLWDNTSTYPKHSRVLYYWASHSAHSEYVALQAVPANQVPPEVAVGGSNSYWKREAVSTPWWNGLVTYSKGAVVNYDHFGDKIYYTYESLVDSNLNKVPWTDDGTNWLSLGPANASAMFDPSNNSRTVAQANAKYVGFNGTEYDGLAFKLSTTDPVSHIAILGMRYVTEVSIRGPEAVAPPVTVTGLGGKQTVIIALPYSISGDNVVEVHLKAAFGFNVEVSNLIVSGQSIELGLTTWGAEPNFIDYSTFDANEFGTVTFVPRTTQRENNYTIEVDTDGFDDFYNHCNNLVKMLAVYDGNNTGSDFDSLRIYGKLISIRPGLSFGQTLVDMRVLGMT
jgi:hypothetical protein